MMEFKLGMRDTFLDSLYCIMREDKDVVFVSADTGAPALDKFWETLPEQCFNVGIAEQQLIGFSAGLAMEGKKVYAYSMAPFISLRCFEQVRLDICSMNLPVCLLGSGAGYASDISGPTHHAVEDVSIMRALPNIVIYSPSDSIMAHSLVYTTYHEEGPKYVRFDRGGLANIYNMDDSFGEGMKSVSYGHDFTIIAHGVMVGVAMSVAKMLSEYSFSVGVLDLFRLKPVDAPLLFTHLRGVERFISLEEHLLAGGLGSILSEIFIDFGIKSPLLRVGIDDEFVFKYGGRKVMWNYLGIDDVSVVSRVLNWLGVKGE